MNENKKFVVTKDSKTDVITYIEYEKLKGFNVKPKKTANFEDMINVDEMIIINPSLIEKLIDKKCKRTLEKILVMLSVLNEEDCEDETPFELIIGETYRLKNLLINKYKEYMDEENYKLQLKKIEIIEKEIELRKSILIQDLAIEQSRKSKPKR